MWWTYFSVGGIWRERREIAMGLFLMLIPEHYMIPLWRAYIPMAPYYGFAVFSLTSWSHHAYCDMSVHAELLRSHYYLLAHTQRLRICLSSPMHFGTFGMAFSPWLRSCRYRLIEIYSAFLARSRVLHQEHVFFSLIIKHCWFGSQQCKFLLHRFRYCTFAGTNCAWYRVDRVFLLMYSCGYSFRCSQIG